MPFLLALSAILCVCAYIAFRKWRQHQHRKQLLRTPLTDQQRRILHAQVPLLRNLPVDLQPKLEGKINLFLDQVTFYGCEDLEVTEEIALSIAGQACLLIVNTKAWYKTLRTLLVYPTAFRSKQVSRNGYVVKEEDVVRLGESWAHGPVILSWAASHQGAQNTADGHNVVLHEFAHQLDALSGQTNGLPILSKRQSFAAWERVVLDAFARHQSSVARNRPTVLDPYGAQNHEEFLAVAIETFFEKPQQLHTEEPALYAQLTLLLDLDPAKWT